MKNIAKILLLTTILSLCLTLAGCSIKIEPKWRGLNSSFMVTINGVEQQKVIDFEVAKSYYLDVRLFGDVDVTDETYKDIKIEYNEKTTIVSYGYIKPRANTVRFYIYLFDVGNDNVLKITYGGKTVEVKYNVRDYDFESANWITPTSIDDLNSFPEFKEMLLSIKYHEFKAPYIGLNIHIYNEYRDEGDWNYDLKDKNDTSYLPYLLDSVYYPSTFDLVEGNVGQSSVYFSYTGKYRVLEGSDASEMNTFSVSFGVVDPCCTKPQNPLRSLTFYAKNHKLNKYQLSGEISEYPVSATILLQKYPERFFEYDLDGLKIYIAVIGNTGVRAYFSDQTYFYYLGAGYVYD